MSDFSKLTGKFGLKEIVSNVKSIINPNAKIPSEIEGDPIGQKAIEIVKCLEALKGNFEKMAEELANLDSAIGNLNQQIAIMRKTQPDKTTSAPSTSAETKAHSEEKAK